MAYLSNLLIASLAAYRITFLITQEGGPFEVFSFLRSIDKLKVLECFYCSSAWVSLPLSVWALRPSSLVGFVNAAIAWFAISGVAIALFDLTTPRGIPLAGDALEDFEFKD